MVCVCGCVCAHVLVCVCVCVSACECMFVILSWIMGKCLVMYGLPILECTLWPQSSLPIGSAIHCVFGIPQNNPKLLDVVKGDLQQLNGCNVWWLMNGCHRFPLAP